MSRTTRSAPNTFAVADDSGAVIGTITTSALGFIAWTTANKSLGGFASMAGAVAAIESAAATHK